MEDKIIIENISSVVELSKIIEQLLTEKPDKRRKNIYISWLKDINDCIKRCNKLANHPIYDLQK